MTKELKKQTIANKKWEEKNKATLEDLEQLEEFIKKRREELNK